MNETEKDMRIHFEGVTNKNLQTVIEYSKETRRLVAELNKRLDMTDNNFQILQEEMKQFRLQLAGVQTKLYSGGSS